MRREDLGASVSRWGLRWSAHAAAALLDDLVDASAVGQAVPANREVIEDYLGDPRGALCLVLAALANGSPVHVVVGYSRTPFVAVTAYRPDPRQRRPGFS